MPRMTAPLLRMSGSRDSPSEATKLLIMPVSSRSATHASVRSRKLMHMGSMMSICKKRCVLGLQLAMK